MDSAKDRRDNPDAAIEAERLEAVEEPLKCVWGGFPSYERSCRSRIPASVVVRAWQREMQLKGIEEGFFYFSWRSGTWLGYGLKDGGVRGVYCPTHCSERADRQSRAPAVGQREAHEQHPPTVRPTGTALQ